MLARCSLSMIQETLLWSKEIETEGFFQERAIVSLTAKNRKWRHFCLLWGTCSTCSFSKVMRDNCRTGIPLTFCIKAKTLFQKLLSLGHSCEMWYMNPLEWQPWRQWDEMVGNSLHRQRGTIYCTNKLLHLPQPKRHLWCPCMQSENKMTNGPTPSQKPNPTYACRAILQ